MKYFHADKEVVAWFMPVVCQEAVHARRRPLEAFSEHLTLRRDLFGSLCATNEGLRHSE